MEKNATSSEDVIIDIDAAVSLWNENNPDNPVSRNSLAIEIGMTNQSAMNYQNGKLPVAFEYAIRIMEKTEIPIEELIHRKEAEDVE